MKTKHKRNILHSTISLILSFTLFIFNVTVSNNSYIISHAYDLDTLVTQARTIIFQNEGQYTSVKKGYYFICTKVLYHDFVGPEYIIVTDDPDITIKHPKTKGMIIVSVEKFASMAEEYNRYYKNDVKHLRRIERSYEEEGYSEECIEADNGEAHSLLPEADLHPVEDIVDQHETEEELRNVMDVLTEKQKRRVEMFYFQQYTEREIAKIEGVQRYAIRSSLKSAISKMKKIL